MSKTVEQIKEDAKKYADSKINIDFNADKEVNIRTYYEHMINYLTNPRPAGASVEQALWTQIIEGDDTTLPKEGGRYWCYLEEVNDLGISHYQWNCSYHEVEKRWGGLEGAKVTHWTNLLPPPGAAFQAAQGQPAPAAVSAGLDLLENFCEDQKYKKVDGADTLHLAYTEGYNYAMDEVLDYVDENRSTLTAAPGIPDVRELVEALERIIKHHDMNTELSTPLAKHLATIALTALAGIKRK